MTKVNDLTKSLIPFEQDVCIVAVVELSQSSWLVAGIVPGIERQPRKKQGPDPDSLLQLLHRWRDEAIRKGCEIRAHCRRVRGRTRRILVGAVVAGSRNRCSRPPFDEHHGLAGAQASEDRSPRHRLADACLSRLAARRAWPLQDGCRADTHRGGCEAVDSSARDTRGRVYAHDQQAEGCADAAWHWGFNPKLRKAQGGLEGLLTPEGKPIPPNMLREMNNELARLAFVRARR